MLLHDLDPAALFPTLPPEVVDALRAHGEERPVRPGDTLFAEGEPGYDFFVVLDGQVRITKRVGNADELLALHGPGSFTGEISLLGGAVPVATARVITEGRVLRIPADTFRALLGRDELLARIVINAMIARARDVGTHLQQQEKLAALGRMSAGLAHELNNPASAVRRAAGALREFLGEVRDRSLEHDCRFDAAQRAAIRELYASAKTVDATGRALELSDREETLGAWLEARGVADAWCHAPTLVGGGVERGQLERLADVAEGETFAAAVEWVASLLAVDALTREVEQSAARMSELVLAMKKYTYMDKSDQQWIDLHEGLDATITILGHKLRKGVEVVREYDRSIPRVCAYGGELNQVWTNLIDNAIHAMGGRGRLVLRTALVHDRARVEVVDDGPGIPDAIRRQIWEPFFTTKPVGQGSGLGLDIVRRIVVLRHGGDVRVQSRPGETRFVVELPLEGHKADACAPGGSPQ